MNIKVMWTDSQEVVVNSDLRDFLISFTVKHILLHINGINFAVNQSYNRQKLF